MLKHPPADFDAFCARVSEAAARAMGGASEDDPEALQSAYRSAIRFVFRVLAALVMESRGIGRAEEACRRLREIAVGQGSWQAAEDALSALAKTTGLSLLDPSPFRISDFGFRISDLPLGQDLKSCPSGRPSPQSAIRNPKWLSALYERMLDLRPQPGPEPSEIVLVPDSRHRKRSGAFFTPPYIIDHIVSHALERVDPASAPKILDPAMGAGDFLLSSLAFLASRADPAYIAENCLYGCDIDPTAVDIARFLVWLEAGGRADARAIANHLICADVLAGDPLLRWQDAFPDVFRPSPDGLGFDAVIGNPPYVAAKNARIPPGIIPGGMPSRGQSDYYLLFLEIVLDNRLVRPGGSLAMVLPDPFLVRANAAEVRRRLLREWTVESIVHVAEAFPGARVANVVLACTNRRSGHESFPVVRLDSARLRRRFEAHPRTATLSLAGRVSREFALAQPRAEVLYLVDERWREVFERIHGREMSLARVVPPFVFLGDIGIENIFRGEEIGKERITASDGDLPILLGGQSVRPYVIAWEGHHISRDAVLKPIEWYRRPKLLLQKSAARLIAAFDPDGFIVPQSVYGIGLRPNGYHPLYLLAILNSTLLNDYTFRAFTGYKLVQPQIELEDVRRLPIRALPFTLGPEERREVAEEGRRTFEEEFSGRAEGFPALAELTARWLASGLEDAAHDLLVHLADLTIRLRRDPGSTSAVAARVGDAIDVVVNGLYEVDSRW